MSNEKNLTPELLEKAKSASSATALLALAQENGITLTAEEAETYYAQLHPEIGALSDEELDNVSGGWCRNPPEKCRICGCTEFIAGVIIGGFPARWYCKNCREYDKVSLTE